MNNLFMILGNYILDLAVVYYWPIISIYILIQNIVPEKISEKRMNKTNIYYKLFAIAWLILFFVSWNEVTSVSMQRIIDTPNIIKKYGILTQMVLVNLLKLAFFYFSAFLIKHNYINIYIYASFRKIIIVTHIIVVAVVENYILISDISDISFIWKLMIVINYVLMISIVLLSGFKLYMDREGVFIGYNTILTQKRVYKGIEDYYEVLKEDDNIVKIQSSESCIIIKKWRKSFNQLMDSKFFKEVKA